jgi:para-aminobenzoate synthetase
MRTLLIDNYDSFTFNLYQYIAEVTDELPIVVRNDSATWDEVSKLDFDNIVISPGPGRVEVPRDFGICAAAIREATVPILGVCLGHQGISHFLGGKVDYAVEVMHGRLSEVTHTGQDIFRDIPSPFSVVRYHSLIVTELPDELEGVAWTQDGILMGVRHRTKPIWGLQFHPESILTDHGHQLIRNFMALTAEAGMKKSDCRTDPVDLPGADLAGLPGALQVAHTKKSPARPKAALPRPESLQVNVRKIPYYTNAEKLFTARYARSRHAFWLDCAMPTDFSRFSYIGDAAGPHAEYVTYDVQKTQVTVERQGAITKFKENIFDYLSRHLRDRYAVTHDLPFDFNCGYVGYLGYELKRDAGADFSYPSASPDAAQIFADRVVVFDHIEKDIYLLCLDTADKADRVESWFNDVENQLKALSQVADRPVISGKEHEVPLILRHTGDEYLDMIRACQHEIKNGESYEICLTNRITADVTIDPLTTYLELRHSNPAPYASFLNFPGIATVGSSPERFITIDSNGDVEAKPIKGTRRRGQSPSEDKALIADLASQEKDRAENLMIVDLLRNDLGAVCEVGSVHVPKIFAVETYSTVHQLVSTIRGRLREDVSAIECVQAAFPGGSMTGAPKKRTMEIIDRLEKGPRGVYSGAIGFLGLNGSADLSIVIRTIVVEPGEVSFGVGGAIVSLSNPQDELDEIFLKAKALIRAIAVTAKVKKTDDTEAASVKPRVRQEPYEHRVAK